LSEIFLDTDEVTNEFNILHQCIEDIDNLTNKLSLGLVKISEFSLGNFDEEHGRKINELKNIISEFEKQGLFLKNKLEVVDKCFEIYEMGGNSNLEFLDFDIEGNHVSFIPEEGNNNKRGKITWKSHELYVEYEGEVEIKEQ
jgi:hypothetical protein